MTGYRKIDTPPAWEPCEYPNKIGLTVKPTDGDKDTHGVWVDLLDDFIEAGYECCRIIDDGKRDYPKGVQTSLNTALRKRGYFPNVCKVSLRNGVIYLLRTDFGKDPRG